MGVAGNKSVLIRHSLHFDLPKCTPILSMLSLFSLRSRPSFISFHFIFVSVSLGNWRQKIRWKRGYWHGCRNNPEPVRPQNTKYTAILKQLGSVHNLYAGRGAFYILKYYFWATLPPYPPTNLNMFSVPPSPQKNKPSFRRYILNTMLPASHRSVKLSHGENVLSPVVSCIQLSYEKSKKSCTPCTVLDRLGQ